MVRNSIYILIAIFLMSCDSKWRESNKISMNIKESKENNVLLAEYHTNIRLDDIVIKEAWVEKVWHIDKTLTTSEIVMGRGCTFCFTVKNLYDGEFSISNYGSYWSIKDASSGLFVGMNLKRVNDKKECIYFISKNDCDFADTIDLVVYVNINGVKERVGSIIFEKKSDH